VKAFRGISILGALVAISGASFAAGVASHDAAPQGQTAPAPAAAAAPQPLPKVCLDSQSADKLTEAFADRLKEAIAASGAMSLGSATDACSLQLHVPGNLLRFQTAGSVMVSTVVIVTSASGRYLSTSIAACQASDLEPCAVRAVSAAKLALLVAANGGP
jgi:hypothetical protein